MAEKLALENRHLSVDFRSENGTVHAVRDVNVEVPAGKTVGLVGESGCGKSVTVQSVLRLHDQKTTSYKGDIIYYDKDGKEYNLLKLSEKEMHNLRGNQISMIFQDPMTSLTPVVKVGVQVSEVIRRHTNLSKEEAKKKAIWLFEQMGIKNPEARYDQYPHEFSGGMQQRIMIAIAMACDPTILIADEPTTALDVTIQAQILQEMKEIQQETGMSIIFITHDLGVVAHMCDDIAVMYAGQIVEYADTMTLFTRPQHPYTQGLLKAIPRIDEQRGALEIIEGMPPKLTREIPGCPFAERCKRRMEICSRVNPDKSFDEKGNMVRCHLYAGEEAKA